LSEGDDVSVGGEDEEFALVIGLVERGADPVDSLESKSAASSFEDSEI
jgi:hypothetical protein